MSTGYDSKHGLCCNAWVAFERHSWKVHLYCVYRERPTTSGPIERDIRIVLEGIGVVPLIKSRDNITIDTKVGNRQVCIYRRRWTCRWKTVVHAYRWLPSKISAVLRNLTWRGAGCAKYRDGHYRR